MYLKQVELENFKSFGGKLTVPLMEGYTAVTGPNGSGKSNISDAILFVLGPKSSKAVRAGKLTDLIFDGGKSKNRASQMRVSLVFDNSDRLMPWDDDIVRLTRHVRVSDNGTDYSSHFYINDRKSTMSEFDSLLTKARISADGYNLVQQGDVTRIVQMGNVERRRIVDSISGIASFDADIDKARAERHEAETNLDRITIVTDELDVQVRKLEKDREDARKYLEAKSALDMARAQHTHRRYQMERSKHESVSEQVARMDASLVDGASRRATLESDIRATDDGIRSKEEEIASKVGPEYRDLKKRIEDAKIVLATKRDRKESAEADLEEQEAFRQKFEDSMASNNAQVVELRQSRELLLVRMQEEEAEKASREAEEREVSEQISSTGGEQRELQDRLDRVEADFEACSTELRTAQGELAKAEVASDEAHNSHSALDERIQNIDFEIKDSKWSLDQLKGEAGPSLEDYGARILDAKRREAELEKQESELDSAYRRIDAEYNSLHAEKKVSDRINRGSAAVEAILSLRNRGEMHGIHGTIQELASVDKGFETALSVAAGGKMQAVVVDDDQVAADAIAYLKKEKLGRVTFLPLSKMMGGKPRAKAIMSVKDTEGYAIDLIDFDQRYYNAFWYVLGDTLVVRDMDAARRIMGGIRIVTMPGELIEASGAMVGGNLSQQNLLKFGAASEDRLTELGEKLRRAAEALDDVRFRLRGVRDEIRAIDDEMRRASSSGIAQREQVAQIRGRMDQLEKARQSASAEMAAVRARMTEADAALEQARSRFGTVSERMAQLTEERTRIKDRIAEIAPVELQNRIQAVRDALYRLRESISDHRLQMGGIDTEIVGYGKQNESLQMQLDSVLEAIAADRAAIEENAAAMERARLDLDALRAIEAEMEGGIEDLRNQKDELLARKYGYEADLRELVKELENTAASKASFEAQLLILAESISNLRAEVEAIGFEVAQPIPSEEEIRRRIRAQEAVISGLGNVNLRAIEDYDEKKGRYDALMGEVAALNRQIRELSDLMEDLTSRKKGLFMRSYDAINENFRSIYAELSGGGEAFMGLEDEDDPFNGGLMINAKPRNGKLLRLESLSGGEKSLTALSFIFAIQEYQPSPFYVLDEVDMFLDSVNAEMVAKRVRESSMKAQFIQVSLRKVTLALADNLIGVTRPPSGISKVIIQPDFSEVSRYEEEAKGRDAEANGDGWEHKD
ncbi:MAG: chromosome segregation protein SMC [Candidatus Methanomethylophilaceae archaeon]|nr:chromosome segregation protein SMC [Candidatus Methanomethylophilaceae archaeon]